MNKRQIPPALIVRALIVMSAAWAANLICARARTTWIATHDILSSIESTLSFLDTPWRLSFDLIDILVGVWTGIITGAALWTHIYNRRQRRPREEHGSATFATGKELATYAHSSAIKNLLFAQGARLSLDSSQTQRNLNALVIGSSGSGKSRYYVLPNLAQANTSFVVTDPKGELYRASASYLRSQGYKVRALNLIDFAESAQFNPFEYFNPHQAEVDVMILTENFITNTNGHKPTAADSGFWEKAERALLNALISYVYFTEPHGTMNDVVRMLAKMEASEQDENATSEIDAIFMHLQDILHDIDDPQNAQENIKLDLEAQQCLDGLRFACSQYRTYLQGAGETKKSVIISLGVRMAPLHMSHIKTLLDADTLALHHIGLEKTALFLIIPDTHAAFSFLVAIIYEQLFETNLHLADSGIPKDGYTHAQAIQNPHLWEVRPGRLPVLVQCFMDEFANIGKMPSFERKIAVMRSRGISMSVIIQNYSQGKALYKDDWETIVGNCDSLLFLGGTEKSTTEYISKQLGKQTIISSEGSLSKGRSGSYSVADRKLGRELLTPDELGRLPGRECIYMLRGLPPFRGKKLMYPEKHFQ